MPLFIPVSQLFTSHLSGPGASVSRLSSNPLLHKVELKIGAALSTKFGSPRCRLFLPQDTGTMRMQCESAATALRTTLAGASVSRIIEDDPELLFLGPRLTHGQYIGQLWQH